MHHVLLDRWSQGASPLHRRDARAKIVTLLVFLVLLATTPPAAAAILAIYSALLIAGVLIAGLPLGGILLRAMVVLPISLTFALISWLAGEPLRAMALVEKSYLSTVAVLLLAATTPLPLLLGGLERLGTPRLLVLVAQFLYRYLFVLSEQSQHMRLAAACREGSGGRRRGSGFRAARPSAPKLRAASGALAVLFARSYERAEGIHQAMQARGFSGRFSLLPAPSFGTGDGAFLVVVSAFLVLVRLG